MAYGEKYNLTFSDLKGDVWRIGIFKKDYVGASSLVKASGQPIQISWTGGGLYTPIRESQATLNLISETDQQYSEFFTANILDYYLELKKNSNIFWRGSYVTETFNEPYVTTPYFIALIFSDVGALKFIDYDGNIQGDILPVFTFLKIINTILAQLPYSMNFVNVSNVFPAAITETVNDTTFSVINTFIQYFEFFNEKTNKNENLKCYEILERICKSFGVTFYQSNNKWYAVRIKELTAEPVNYVEFNALAITVAASGTLNLRKNITNTEAGITFLFQDAEMESDDVYNDITYGARYSQEFIGISGYEIVKDYDMLKSLTASGAAAKMQWWLLTNLTAGTDVTKITAAGGSMNCLGNMLSTSFITTRSLKARRVPGETVSDNRFFSTTSKGLLNIEFQIKLTNTNYEAADENLIYEVEIPIRIKIGNYYLKDDGTGTLSWSLTASNVRFKKDFDYGSYDSLVSFSGDIITYYAKDILIETPLFPETGEKDIEVFIYPIVIMSLKSGQITTSSFLLRTFSYQYLWDGNEVTGAYNTSFSQMSSIRERSLNVDIYFGDSSFQFNQSNSGIIFTLVASVLATTSQWHRRGVVETKPHSQIFILEPYSEFYTQYRKIVTGTLYGNTDFDFHNTLVLKEDSSIMFIDELNYEIKSGSQNARMIQLLAVTPTKTINIFDVEFLPLVRTNENILTTTVNKQEATKKLVFDNSGAISNQGNNLTQKGSRILLIDSTKGNSTNYNNYPV